MAKKIIVFGGFLFFFTFVSFETVMAETPTLERFKSRDPLKVESIVTPKVVIFETESPLGVFTALQDQESQDFLPHKVKKINPPANRFRPFFKTSSSIDGHATNLQDDDFSSYLTFDPANINHTITFKNPQRKALRGIKINLPVETIWPKKIHLEAKLDDQNWKSIVSNQWYQSHLNFPEISPSEIRITIHSPNLLRVNEIEILTNETSATKHQIIFYAQEGQSLFLWSNPDFGQARIPVSNNSTSGLRADDKTPVFEFYSSEDNPIYNPDFDGDGILDSEDLCPRTIDSQNSDIDQNGRGDACEDPDQDGIISNKDNCPFVVNYDQSDLDQDGKGDKCDGAEDRLSEQSNLWIKGSFLLMIFALLFLIMRSAIAKPKK